MQACIEELNQIKKDFDMYKAEVALTRARHQKVEMLVRRDMKDEARVIKISDLRYIYEGEWQQSKPSSPKKEGIQQIYCDMHAKGRLDLYCLTDIVPICNKCFIEVHWRCSVCSIHQLKCQE